MTNMLDRLTEALNDRYTLERELGAGGMATVYLADDPRHHRPVALKVLRPELAVADWKAPAMRPPLEPFVRPMISSGRPTDCLCRAASVPEGT